MVRALLRAVLFGSVFLALWTLARPASAAIAPLCDDRGASGVAALPTPLEAPEDTIQRAHATATCERDEILLGSSVRSTHKGAPKAAPSAPEPAQPTAQPRLVFSAGSDARVLAVVARPRDGVRYRVERPPRG
jgi:hypothetical protein